jgi:hypothetical protein
VALIERNVSVEEGLEVARLALVIGSFEARRENRSAESLSSFLRANADQRQGVVVGRFDSRVLRVQLVVDVAEASPRFCADGLRPAVEPRLGSGVGARMPLTGRRPCCDGVERDRR